MEQRASIRAPGRELQRDVRSRSGSAAFGLMRAGLSAKGFEKSRNTMRLNGYLAELVKNFDEYGEYLYHLTVMGVPSSTEPWGWQLDGHHLVINYFVLGDQVVMTPSFMGSEPVTATTGQYAGTAFCKANRISGSRSCARCQPTSRSRRPSRRPRP